MNIRDYASDFAIFIFSQDPDLGTKMKLGLTALKYDTYFFSDVDEMQTRVQLSPPHIVVIDHAGLAKSLSEVFQSILKISNEVKFLCVADNQFHQRLIEFKDYNLAQFFDRSSDELISQIGLSVDSLCECLYRLYQNEQIFNMYQKTRVDLENAKSDAENQKRAPVGRPFQSRIADYRLAESKEDLLQRFFKQTPMQSWVFLKFVKSINSFISVASTQVPPEWVEGLNYKIPNQDADFVQNAIIGSYGDHFLNYIKRKWSVDIIKIMPLVWKDNLEGLLVTPQDISAEVAEDFSLVSLVYALISNEHQPKQLDVEDPLTGLFNVHFYKRILEKETDRSKRTFAPVSVIKVAVDSLKEIEVSQGRSFAEEILRKVAEMLRKSSRIPDYVCRTDENEFSIILTNCNRKGAALRAERLRQALKSESFSKSGLVITISQGISEYPSLSKTAETLEESAKKTLDFILTKGGDKICIYKAPRDHKPDFQVNT